MRGFFLELTRAADLDTQLKARRYMNRALHVFSSRQIATLTPAELKRLYAAAEDYILDPANNVPRAIVPETASAKVRSAKARAKKA